jgi:hypothetical protein
VLDIFDAALGEAGRVRSAISSRIVVGLLKVRGRRPAEFNRMYGFALALPGSARVSEKALRLLFDVLAAFGVH